MNDLKSIIANNISELRQGKGMTQLELAEKLNYSDKAISKWERGESLPDIVVLTQIAEIFSVSLDYLITEEHQEVREEKAKEVFQVRYNRAMIVGMSLSLVWFISMLFYVSVSLVMDKVDYLWLCFIYAIPASIIVCLVFNSIWFNTRRNYIIISLLMWTVLLSLHLSFIPFGMDLSRVYLLGIPSQLCILMWSRIKKIKETRKEKKKEQ